MVVANKKTAIFHPKNRSRQRKNKKKIFNTLQHANSRYHDFRRGRRKTRRDQKRKETIDLRIKIGRSKGREAGLFVTKQEKKREKESNNRSEILEEPRTADPD